MLCCLARIIVFPTTFKATLRRIADDLYGKYKLANDSTIAQEKCISSAMEEGGAPPDQKKRKILH